MNTDRIKEIQNETAYPDSVSVCQALLKVWNETEQKQLRQPSVSGALPLLDNILKKEMSAEMRTWLMELRLLIGNDR